MQISTRIYCSQRELCYEIFSLCTLSNFADLNPTRKNFQKLNFSSWADVEFVKCFAPARFPNIVNSPKKNTRIAKFLSNNWERTRRVFFLSNCPLIYFSTNTTAGDVYMVDSAQVPRVQAKYTADSAQVPRVHVQVHQGDSRGVLGHGRGVLELKLQEEESKYTKAIAEVYLLSSECNFKAMLTRREASTQRRQPRCTWLPPSQYCCGVSRVFGLDEEYLSWICTKSATSTQFWLGGRQVHRGDSQSQVPGAGTWHLNFQVPSALCQVTWMA